MIDNKITNTVHVPYLKPSIDETVGLAKGSDVYVVNAGEFQLFDHANDKFIKYDSLLRYPEIFCVSRIFLVPRWTSLAYDRRSCYESHAARMARLVQRHSFLTTVSDGKGLWLITANNELYKFTPTPKERPEAFPLFLRNIHGPEDGVVEARHLKIEEEKGALTFEFVQPDYNGFETIEPPVSFDRAHRHLVELVA